MLLRPAPLAVTMATAQRALGRGRVMLGWLLLVLALTALPGCSATDVPDAKSSYGRAPTLPETPEMSETVRGENDPPVVTLKVSSELRQRRLKRTENLPEMNVPAANLQGVPIGVALEGVLQGTDIALTYADAALIERPVNLINLSGALPRVINRICDAARLFCSYRNGNLELTESETFVVDLPATGEVALQNASSSMAMAIEKLASTSVQIDNVAGNLIYTANYAAHEQVMSYLEELRAGRPLVVLQMYIWDVSLDSNSSQGINWSNLRIPDVGGKNLNVAPSLASAVGAVSGGVSMGAVFKGAIDASIIANFLSRQGVVQNVSNPQMTFVSGTQTKFNVGGTRRFVTSIGSSSSSSVAGNDTASTSNTVNTETLDTGLNLEISGSYDSGVIIAKLDLKITDFLGFDDVPTGIGNNIIQQPRTSDRELNTVLRVRPGDNLLLAGITTSRDTLNRDKIPLPFSDRGIPLRDRDELNNSELVILIKPSVVLFADEKTIADAKQEEATRPLPEPLVVDGLGARPISFETDNGLLQSQIEQASAAASGERTGTINQTSAELAPVVIDGGATPPSASAATNIPSASTGAATNVAFPSDLRVPVGEPGPDVSLVDRGLLQRGMSYAFDELLRPLPTNQLPASSLQSRVPLPNSQTPSLAREEP